MALGTAGYTAALAIHLLEQNDMAPANGKVLVNGATGGVATPRDRHAVARSATQVTAVTGKDAEHEFLKKIGAAEVLAREALDMGTRPLEKALWAAAFDSVGGEQLGWLTRTMQPHGLIASFGNAGGIELNTTVLPFILRGVRLIGVDSGIYADAAAAQGVGAAGDRPQAAPSRRYRADHHAGRSAGAISRKCSKGEIRGRAVVRIS